MKTICAKPLTLESFNQYGNFTNLTDCSSTKIGENPIEFFRDIVSCNLCNICPSFSVVKTWKRDMVIDEAEQHFYTAEALLPLDGDIVIFVAPSTDRTVPFDEIEAFIVPKNTLVTVKSGVWHKAPFPVNDEIVHSLVILPERTYANDCLVVKFPEDKKILIK